MAFVAKRGLQQVLQKSAEDVVIVTALRTPFGKFKGTFKVCFRGPRKRMLADFHMKQDAYPEELLASILSATRERLEAQGLDVKSGLVEDISTGTVLMELGGAKSGRMAALHAGSVLSPLRLD